MEKRFALALALSFLFFIIWGRLFPPTNPPTDVQQTKTIENKEVVAFSQGTDLVRDHLNEEAAKNNMDAPEELYVIENEKIRLFVSDLGAHISKVEFKEYGGEPFFVSSGAVVGQRNLPYEVFSQNGQKIVLIGQNDSIKITKTYEILENTHSIVEKTEFLNQAEEAKTINVEIEQLYLDAEWLKNAVDKTTGEKKDMSRDRNLLEYSIYSNDNVLRKTGAFEFKEKEEKKELSSAKWFGYRNRYFCFVARPDYVIQGFSVDVISKERLSIFELADKRILNGGEAVNFDRTLYFGPQKAELLEKVDESFAKIHVYFKSQMLDAIAKIIQDTVVFFYKGISNWGICIILVSVLIYGLMYPLTFKSLLSMRKMQSLQPKIQLIREKYEDNPQKLNQEIMKLYGENKINPLGGCLPIFLQMPIFIGLYQVLWRSVWFKGSGFLWIKDLSEPDRFMVFSKQFPVIGSELNVLPLVMMVLMFVQQKMSTRNMKVTDPNQLAQQKMMTTIFPLFLGFIFYKLASGLSLYFTVFYLLSIVSQVLVAKHMDKEPQ
ncbi:MAG TPA: YidC/Oxa1 family insertase periplasmic-domain containing protein [Candidatus Omnitrophota bacterium]|jgi:YidC/Oxa1 family membrane protein insertase|nr:YidC/Oxa1 family insertase periplasmic-domain containing protein [Candidatus Omnitrophota bacterium]